MSTKGTRIPDWLRRCPLRGMASSPGDRRLFSQSGMRVAFSRHRVLFLCSHWIQRQDVQLV